jgi:hypothetical protein
MNERRHPPTGHLPWRRNGQRLTGTRSLSPFGGVKDAGYKHGVLRSKTPFSSPQGLRPLQGRGLFRHPMI